MELKKKKSNKNLNTIHPIIILLRTRRNSMLINYNQIVQKDKWLRIIIAHQNYPVLNNYCMNILFKVLFKQLHSRYKCA